ncbi:hypothetical protein [Salirhabdus sp. Marseille-P4669]|uniref:hypothetical protein n=1 Tax=Salirhabdus sp. Marseille-P4669 TaxID=2042310 RepID=UPI000C7BA5A5|nr:hypothetical protein [Salirhabdus sp. Marseille-P4669]
MRRLVNWVGIRIKRIFKKEKPSQGYTVFKPLGVQKNFLTIDLNRQQVECEVRYKNKRYLTVHIDVGRKTVHTKKEKNGYLSPEIEGVILDDIQRTAEFIIDHGIDDPKAYIELVKGDREGN